METSAAPWPLLQTAIEPQSRADEEKLRAALAILAKQDIHLQIAFDEEAGQALVGGHSESQLDKTIDRLSREFLIDVRVGAPRVAYRETITRAHKQDYTHEKQFGGKGQFARVQIVFEPNPDSANLAFESRIAVGRIPIEYVAGVEAGLRTVVSSGPLAGFPMIGVKATLMDGACHDADSSVRAFEIAGRACLRVAAPHLGVQLLEPMMTVEVTTPASYASGVIAELNSRRGQLQEQESRGAAVVVSATVPLASMFKLEDSLRSRSDGQASVSVGYAGYSPVPLPDGDPPPGSIVLA